MIYPPSSAKSCPASAREEVQPPSLAKSLWTTRTWLFPFIMSVIWFSTADSSTLDDMQTLRKQTCVQALRKQTCGSPLVQVHSASVEWGGWRGGGQAGPEDPLKEFQHPSSWDDTHLLCRAVWFAAKSLALLQAILLSTVDCISLRVLLLGFGLFFF